MLFLGIDLGTSSIKVSVIDADTQQCIASAQYPKTEVDIMAPQTGWAEQSPDLWWKNAQQAILKCNATQLYNPKDIIAIGIAYQMHGLVWLIRGKVFYAILSSGAIAVRWKLVKKLSIILEKKNVYHTSLTLPVILQHQS